MNTCEGCKGGFRCMNPNSPCYLYYCGEYPGTGVNSNQNNPTSKDKTTEK